jgi:hypothetical protein
MLRLRHNAREAQAELLLEVHGRLPFGGVRIVDVGQSREGDRRAWWLAKRAEELASMAPPVSVDGRLRHWLQFDGSPAVDASAERCIQQ